MTGIVKQLTPQKGYGFIKGDDEVERFFHRSEVEGSFDALREGQRVRFKPEDNPKGPRASDVVAL